MALSTARIHRVRGSSTAFGSWDHIFDPLPLFVGQVAGICFCVHILMLHNPRRLFRQALRLLDEYDTLTVAQLRALLEEPVSRTMLKVQLHRFWRAGVITRTAVGVYRTGHVQQR